MATSSVTPVKLAGAIVLAMASLYMGYTVLLAKPTSVYAAQNEPTEASQATSSPMKEATPALSESVPDRTPQEALQASSPSLVSVAVQQKLEQLTSQPESVPTPITLNHEAKSYLAKASELSKATLEANVREQNLRAQPPKDDGDALGLNFSLPVTPTPVAPVIEEAESTVPTITLGSLVQVDHQHWQARLYVQGRWYKVQQGTRIGELSVLAISERGVRLREHGKTYWLTRGASL